MKQRFLEYPKSSIAKARMLRRNQTDEEKMLWQIVRNNGFGVKFRRQVPFGPYILDFYCHSLMLAIELDGSQHLTKESKEYDKARDEYLKSYGISVIRIPNSKFREDQYAVMKFLTTTIQNICSSRPSP